MRQTVIRSRHTIVDFHESTSLKKREKLLKLLTKVKRLLVVFFFMFLFFIEYVFTLFGLKVISRTVSGRYSLLLVVVSRRDDADTGE
jgi:small neutral amino acid transporter SnatA (MarC family)